MNPIDFINSKDVRAHLKKIGYKPGLLEAAYFIYHSYIKTLAEKEAAWKELIASTDDMILSKELNWRWERDEWMVDHANRLIAVYNGNGGGTKHTMDYARKQDVQIVELRGKAAI